MHFGCAAFGRLDCCLSLLSNSHINKAHTAIITFPTSLSPPPLLNPIVVRLTCSMLAGAARGLDYLHKTLGVVHADIKPGNLLVAKDLTVKVADFGLSGESPAETYEKPKTSHTTRRSCGGALCQKHIANPDPACHLAG